MGYKKLSKEQELELVEEYRQGTPVITLQKNMDIKAKSLLQTR